MDKERGVSEVQLFKVLGPRGESIHGGNGAWGLPRGSRPGVWMPTVAPVSCCLSGYHLVELYSLPEWLRADCTIYLAQGKGKSDSGGIGKTAFAQARLIRQLHVSNQDLRLFAADCAEHVVHLYEAKYPKDDRPRRAIEAARAFARGEIDAAARDAAAAWAAAEAARDAGAEVRVEEKAARAAAWAAAWAAGAAEAAAWAAARAGGAAAWAAGAAWAAERQWQSSRLGEYMDLT